MLFNLRAGYNTFQGPCIPVLDAGFCLTPQYGILRVLPVSTNESIPVEPCALVFAEQVFFDGIESKLAAGIRTDEVGYQLQFSKQELRKVIKEYTGKEVSEEV